MQPRPQLRGGGEGAEEFDPRQETRLRIPVSRKSVPARTALTGPVPQPNGRSRMVEFTVEYGSRAGLAVLRLCERHHVRLTVFGVAMALAAQYGGWVEAFSGAAAERDRQP